MFANASLEGKKTVGNYKIDRVPYFQDLTKSFFKSYTTNRETFVILKQLVAVLITDFTIPDNLMIDLLICCYLVGHSVIKVFLCNIKQYLLNVI